MSSGNRFDGEASQVASAIVFFKMPYLETSQDFSSKSIPGVVSSVRNKAANFTLGLLQLFGVYVGVYIQ